MAMRARLRSVGTTRPVSSWERKLAESPVCLPNSTSPMDFFSRNRLIRSPIRFSTMTASALAPSTSPPVVSPAASSPAVRGLVELSLWWDVAVCIVTASLANWFHIIKDAAAASIPARNCKYQQVLEVLSTKPSYSVRRHPTALTAGYRKILPIWSLMNRKIVLSGGTGLIGKSLRQTLVREGAQVLLLVRRPAQPDAAAGVTEVEWHPDAPDPISDPTPLEGCDAAVHLSGANVGDHRWTPSYKRTIRASRVDSSVALKKIFSALSSPPPVVVAASATGYYGDRGNE